MKWSIFFLFFLISFFSYSQNNYTEVVYLKSGTKVSGVILEQIPNEKLKIQTDDGSIFVFKYSEIEKITKELSKSNIKETPSYNINNSAPSYNTNTNTYKNYSGNGGMLQNGSPIFIRLLNTISSATKDEPNFVVNGDVKDGIGNILIADGTQVRTESTITTRKAIGRPGKIDIKFVSTTAVDGQFITLTGSKSYTAADKKGKVIGVAVGVGLLVVWPMLAYLAKKGDDIEVPAGTMLSNNVIIMGNYTIK